MLPQIFFFLIDALRLILRHSGGTCPDSQTQFYLGCKENCH